MYVVAIAELRGAVEEDLAALAADMGATAYDARLLVAAGTPAVVKTTADRALALDLLGRLRARGHGAVACDAAAVIGSADMVAMRRPRLGTDAVELDGAEPLAYADILALLPAVHHRRVDTATETRETKLSMGRALMTGGVSFTKSVKTTTRSANEEREGVLYVFRRSGARPWLLREHGTSWAGLGLPLAHSESENYRQAIAALRARAPGAAFDDRLVTRKASERSSLSGGGGNTSVRTSSEAGMDLLAHLMALWIAKEGRAGA